LGFDLYQRIVGIVGTEKIGVLVAQSLHGFDRELLAHDLVPIPVCTAFGVRYVSLPEIYARADIITWENGIWRTMTRRAVLSQAETRVSAQHRGMRPAPHAFLPTETYGMTGQNRQGEVLADEIVT
jgi:hypothetical protein